MIQSHTATRGKAALFVIKKAPDEVSPFANAVQKHADAEKSALGFIPKTAYEDAALQGKLWVAVKRTEEREEYVGHILWGGAFPRLRIFQMFVAPPYRRQGVASILIDDLKNEAESLNYLTISARVADDLDANLFWDRQGFEIARSLPGGATTNRLIHYRERRLNTPSLFDLLDAVAAPTDNDLRLVERLYAKAPIYTFDVNVLLDITQARPRAEDARKIIAAAMENLIRLSIADEFVVELERSSPTNQNDPVLQFASSLPRFPAMPKSEEGRLILELGQIVFPEKMRQNRLKARDKSDLLHLASAVHNRVSGFLTSEQAILKRRALFRERYALDIIAVTEFARSIECLPWQERKQVVAVSDSASEIIAAELTDDNRADVQCLLDSLRVESALMNDALAPGSQRSQRRRLVLSAGARVLAYASWDAPQSAVPHSNAFVFVDDASELADRAVDYCSFLIMTDASQQGPILVRIVSKVSAAVEECLKAVGFRRAHTTNPGQRGSLQKVCLGKVVYEGNWRDVRDGLNRKLHVRLPDAAPTYADAEKAIVITNPQDVCLSVPLNRFEELVGPSLFVLAGRPAAIVPIRRRYSERLLRTSQQFEMFAAYEAAVLARRTYYSSVSALSVLQPGTILLFYESKADGGAGAIVACARSVANQVETVKNMKTSVKRGGVLDDDAIQRICRTEQKGVTLFDTLMKFRQPILYAKLKKSGYITGANLVTSQKISHLQLIALLEEGRPYV